MKELGRSIGKNRELAPRVAAVLARLSAEAVAESRTDPAKGSQALADASAFALAAVTAAAGDGGRSGLAALRGAIEPLGPVMAGNLGTALAASGDKDAAALLGQALTATIDGPPTDASNALALQAFLGADNSTYREVVRSERGPACTVASAAARPMAAAMARVMHPVKPDQTEEEQGKALQAQAQETVRLTALMTSEDGVKLFTARFVNEAGTKFLRMGVINFLAANPKMTAAGLMKNGSPWLNRDLAQAMGEAFSEAFQRDGAGEARAYEDYAYAKAAGTAGNEAGNRLLDGILKAGKDINWDVSKLTVRGRPLLHFTEVGPEWLPQFEVAGLDRKGKRQSRIVDYNGAWYASREKWEKGTALSDGLMSFAAGIGPDGNLQIKTEETPETHNFRHHVERYADTGVPAIAAVGAFTPLAPFTTAGAGIYGVYRGGEIIYERESRNQEVSLGDSETRSAVFFALAGLSGMAASAANPARLGVQAGRTLTAGAAPRLATAANWTALGINSAALLNTGADFIGNLQDMTPVDRFKESMFMAFEAAMIGVSTRSLLVPRAQPQLQLGQDPRAPYGTPWKAGPSARPAWRNLTWNINYEPNEEPPPPAPRQAGAAPPAPAVPARLSDETEVLKISSADLKRLPGAGLDYAYKDKAIAFLGEGEPNVFAASSQTFDRLKNLGVPEHFLPDARVEYVSIDLGPARLAMLRKPFAVSSGTVDPETLRQFIKNHKETSLPELKELRKILSDNNIAIIGLRISFDENGHITTDSPLGLVHTYRDALTQRASEGSEVYDPLDVLDRGPNEAVDQNKLLFRRLIEMAEEGRRPIGGLPSGAPYSRERLRTGSIDFRRYPETVQANLGGNYFAYALHGSIDQDQLQQILDKAELLPGRPRLHFDRDDVRIVLDIGFQANREAAGSGQEIPLGFLRMEKAVEEGQPRYYVRIMGVRDGEPDQDKPVTGWQGNSVMAPDRYPWNEFFHDILPRWDEHFHLPEHGDYVIPIVARGVLPPPAPRASAGEPPPPPRGPGGRSGQTTSISQQPVLRWEIPEGPRFQTPRGPVAEFGAGQGGMPGAPYNRQQMLGRLTDFRRRYPGFDPGAGRENFGIDPEDPGRLPKHEIDRRNLGGFLLPNLLQGGPDGFMPGLILNAREVFPNPPDLHFDPAEAKIVFEPYRADQEPPAAGPERTLGKLRFEKEVVEGEAARYWVKILGVNDPRGLTDWRLNPVAAPDRYLWDEFLNRILPRWDEHFRLPRDDDLLARESDLLPGEDRPLPGYEIPIVTRAFLPPRAQRGPVGEPPAPAGPQGGPPPAPHSAQAGPGIMGPEHSASPAFGRNELERVAEDFKGWLPLDVQEKFGSPLAVVLGYGKDLRALMPWQAAPGDYNAFWRDLEHRYDNAARLSESGRPENVVPAVPPRIRDDGMELTLLPGYPPSSPAHEMGPGGSGRRQIGAITQQGHNVTMDIEDVDGNRVVASFTTEEFDRLFPGLSRHDHLPVFFSPENPAPAANAGAISDMAMLKRADIRQGRSPVTDNLSLSLAAGNYYADPMAYKSTYGAYFYANQMENLTTQGQLGLESGSIRIAGGVVRLRGLAQATVHELDNLHKNLLPNSYTGGVTTIYCKPGPNSENLPPLIDIFKANQSQEQYQMFVWVLDGPYLSSPDFLQTVDNILRDNANVKIALNSPKSVADRIAWADLAANYPDRVLRLSDDTSRGLAASGPHGVSQDQDQLAFLEALKHAGNARGVPDLPHLYNDTNVEDTYGKAAWRVSEWRRLNSLWLAHGAPSDAIGLVLPWQWDGNITPPWEYVPRDVRHPDGEWEIQRTQRFY
jgi:hypothetical protein